MDFTKVKINIIQKNTILNNVKRIMCIYASIPGCFSHLLITFYILPVETNIN